MIIKLTPETYFEHVNREGPLHVVMHYGVTCGPCQMTMPFYEAVVQHFVQHNVTNVKFYRFHHWEPTYKPFIEQHNLSSKGIPSFKYFYFGGIITENVRSFNNPDDLKKSIMDSVRAIETTMGEFDLYAN